MTDVLFFEKDGFTYAKGFFNQEGCSFYVLPGHKDVLYEKLEAMGLMAPYSATPTYVEELSDLPGGSRCPPEAP